MLERKWMRVWIERHVKAHPRDYWLRIPDSADGIKPFDGVLMCWGNPEHADFSLAPVTPLGIEFKVWRGAGRFRMSAVEPHQMRELLRWKAAGGDAWILVYFERTHKERVFYPTTSALKKLLHPQRKTGH